MEKDEIQLVRRIVAEELGPALDERFKEIEDSLIASNTAFQQQVRADGQQVRIEVRQDHAENRIRLQEVDRQATKAVAQTEIIIDRLDKQDEANVATQNLIVSLIGEVRSWAGRREGQAEADAHFQELLKDDHDKTEKARGKIILFLKWVVGLASSGGLWTWISKHYHHGGK